MSKRLIHKAFAAATYLALASCAAQLEFNPHDAELEASDSDTDQGGGAVDGGTVRTVIDATDYDVPQHWDLDSGERKKSGWDLLFRRFLILSNGGVSGDGGVQILKLPDIEFDELTRAPDADEDWQVDEADGPDDEDAFPDNPFCNGTEDWYDYDLNTHTLTARDTVYVIRSTEGRFFKLQLLDYYDAVGTPAFVEFMWAEIDPPPTDLEEQERPNDPNVIDVVNGDGDTGSDSDTSGEDTDTERGGDTADETESGDTEDETDSGGDPEPGGDTDTAQDPGIGPIAVDASSYEEFVYFSAEDGPIAIEDPGTSLAWDLAVRRYVFLTNSGSSGPGAGGAKLDESGQSFEELMSVEPDGFSVDEVLPADGSPGSVEGTGNEVLAAWYDYEGLGVLTPKDETFIIRTAEGAYAKLKVHSYSGGRYSLSFAPIVAWGD